MRLSFSDRFVFGSLFILRSLADKLNKGKFFFGGLNNKYLSRLNNKFISSDLARGFGKIDRVKNISPEDFYKNYYLKSRPVVIEGLYDSWLRKKNWNIDFFKKEYGDAVFPMQLTRDTKGGDYGLSQKNATLREIINQFQKKDRDEETYVSFAPIFQVIPELKEEFDYSPIRKYSKNKKDIFTRLFLGPKDSTTQIHCSAACNFFLQIQGRKTWKFFSPRMTPLLYPIPDLPIAGPAFRTGYYYYENGDNLENFPLAKYLEGIEITLDPGDVLYVPPFHWHWVYSHDDCVSLANWWFVPELFFKSSPYLGIVCGYSYLRGRGVEKEGKVSVDRFKKHFIKSNNS